MESDINFRRDIGKRGEDEACRMLMDMGHVILERNWRSGHLEIDIISYDSGGIHFVEVKTRGMNMQAPPQENVDRTKQNRIVRAAQGFLRTRKGLPYGDYEYNFDIVAVTYDGHSFLTEWFPQAYIPLYI